MGRMTSYMDIANKISRVNAGKMANVSISTKTGNKRIVLYSLTLTNGEEYKGYANECANKLGVTEKVFLNAFYSRKENSKYSKYNIKKVGLC